jgi:hypothetical protein
VANISNIPITEQIVSIMGKRVIKITDIEIPPTQETSDENMISMNELVDDVQNIINFYKFFECKQLFDHFKRDNASNE